MVWSGQSYYSFKLFCSVLILFLFLTTLYVAYSEKEPVVSDTHVYNLKRKPITPTDLRIQSLPENKQTTSYFERNEI